MAKCDVIPGIDIVSLLVSYQRYYGWYPEAVRRRSLEEGSFMMRKTTVALPEEELQALRRLASAEGETVSGLVRRAVDRLLSDEARDDCEWQNQLDRLLAGVRGRVPAAISPAEIERDVTTARGEVRRAHHARRR